MATHAIPITTCFLLTILATCCQTQARESKFFSKYAHLATNNFVTVPSSTNLKIDVPASPTPSSAPTTSQISAVPAASPQGPDFSPSPTTLGDKESPSPAPTIVAYEYSPAPSPTWAGESPTPAPAPFEDEEEEEAEFSPENSEELNYYNNREVYTYTKSEAQAMSDTRIGDNKYYYDNEHEHESQPQGMSDTRMQGSSEYYYNPEHENYSPRNHESQPQGMRDTRNNMYHYDNEPQGMSDTRIENNKKYYNGVEQDNYNPVGGERNNEEGYYYNGSYNKSKYEFDSMEEYEKQQGYADVQQEFINP
ncbi:microtubule-associated protein RP/EB family member 1-like [Salvia divinorum]|uniref:Microtubule-associated protein RP/EB family member 1-like n=1 Tax=Salvia divinorum TaxID=28513 RepID=A0ABD1I220_SALDI